MTFSLTFPKLKIAFGTRNHMSDGKVLRGRSGMPPSEFRGWHLRASFTCEFFFFDSSELGLQAPRLAATSRAVVPSAGRSGACAPGSAAPRLCHQAVNHLGNTALTLPPEALLLSREKQVLRSIKYGRKEPNFNSEPYITRV